jgi:hypothetical protein
MMTQANSLNAIALRYRARGLLLDPRGIRGKGGKERGKRVIGSSTAMAKDASKKTGSDNTSSGKRYGGGE